MPLRDFNKTYVDKQVQLRGEIHNTLLHNCEIADLRGVTLLNCDLNQSKILIDDINKLQGFACTMDCGTFRNVTLSETVFDCLVMLLYSTKGNDNKRRKLIDVVGKDKMKELAEQMESIDL